MKILVACEESQAVTIELRKLGHEAYSCDIVECSGGHPEWHIMGDALNVINGSLDGGDYFCTSDNKCHKLPKRWDMIIAHPPCTYMSKAGARWMYPKAGELCQERLELALEAKAFFFAILNADCEKICVENPRPLKIVGLPTPSQIIQPYEFGHPFSKETCLWLKGLPALQPTKTVEEYAPYVPSNTSKHSRGGGGSCGVAKTAAVRSKTFPGVARAMAQQWAGLAIVPRPACGHYFDREMGEAGFAICPYCEEEVEIFDSH